MHPHSLFFYDSFSATSAFPLSFSPPMESTFPDSPPVGSVPLFPFGGETFVPWDGVEPLNGGETAEGVAAAAASARAVHFQAGIEDPATSAECIAERKQQRRQEVRRARHLELASVWEEVMALQLGETERAVARALIGAAIGLNSWPRVGALLKWRPFQSSGCLGRLSGSMDECHAELWQEMESFLVTAIQARLGGVPWSWDPSMAGPWVEAMAAWPDVDALITNLFEQAQALDERWEEQGGGGARLFSLAEAWILTLSRQLADGELGYAMQLWADLSRPSAPVPHPLLARTVAAWQRAAAAAGDFYLSGVLLRALQGNPEDPGYLFVKEGTALSLQPFDEALSSRAVAHLAAFKGPHAVNPSEIDRAVAALATQAFHRTVASASAEGRFWKGLSVLDELGLLERAVQELACEESHLLARVGRNYFPPRDAQHFGLAGKVAKVLIKTLLQEQVERLQRSALNEAQRLWLVEGFQTIEQAACRNLLVMAPLFQFLHRQQRAFESLADRVCHWQQAWDWRAELVAIEMGKSGAIEEERAQIDEKLRELFFQLSRLWSDPAGQVPDSCEAQALRRAAFMLAVEERGEEAAMHALLRIGSQGGCEPLGSSQPLTGWEGLARAELADLHSYVIQRLSSMNAPRRLRQALSRAEPLSASNVSARSILFEEEDDGSECLFGGVKALRELSQKCVVDLVSRRVATAWATLAVGPASEGELDHCVETMRLADRVFKSNLPHELRLRFARVMRHPEIARRMGLASAR